MINAIMMTSRQCVFSE